LAENEQRCFYCGSVASTNTSSLSHFRPKNLGGGLVFNNLLTICASCNQVVGHQPREAEFVRFLAELLGHHKAYSNLRVDTVLGRETRYRADILVDHKGAKYTKRLLIECKASLGSGSLFIDNVISQLNKYQAAYGECSKIFATPVSLGESDSERLRAANIDIWDLNYITRNFAAQICLTSTSYYKALFSALNARPKGLTEEQRLIKSLESCAPGRKDCYVYQDLVGEIIELLFTPPLAKPIPELSDKSEANRRDLIVPNYTEEGFWSFMRQKYEADYVVIDAKNYTRKVKKQDVLQLANYLKSHGAGLFGLIVSRQGGDSSGCEHTLREQWLIHRKLIIVLDDEDIKAMLMAKSDGRRPEEILAGKIERFRLSM
jgi:hypothetical protein